MPDHAMRHAVHHAQGLVRRAEVEHSRVAREDAEGGRSRQDPRAHRPVAGHVIKAVRHALHVGVAVEGGKRVAQPGDVHVREQHAAAHEHKLPENAELEAGRGVVVGGSAPSPHHSHVVGEAALVQPRARLRVQGHDESIGHVRALDTIHVELQHVKDVLVRHGDEGVPPGGDYLAQDGAELLEVVRCACRL